MVSIIVDCTSYNDHTWKFLYTSSGGDNCIFVAYHYDVNTLLVKVIKNCATGPIISAWKKMNNRSVNTGCKPQKWIMDNECLFDLKDALTKKKLLVSSCPHTIILVLINQTEKVTQTDIQISLQSGASPSPSKICNLIVGPSTIASRTHPLSITSVM